MHFSYIRNASTLTARLWAAVGMVKRISWLPHSVAQKAMFVANGALNLGLYGSEAANANEQDLGALTTAIAMAVGPHTHKACKHHF